MYVCSGILIRHLLGIECLLWSSTLVPHFYVGQFEKTTFVRSLSLALVTCSNFFDSKQCRIDIQLLGIECIIQCPLCVSSTHDLALLIEHFFDLPLLSRVPSIWCIVRGAGLCTTLL